MGTNVVKIRLESPILKRLEGLPYLSLFARTRGWHFIISWCNRIAGLILVVYLWAHIYVLSFLHTSSDYDENMKVFRWVIFAFLQWALSIPVIFHALNGGRLILYEIYGKRSDDTMIRWMLGLSAIYVVLLGLFMLLGNQSVSPFLFWVLTLVTGLLIGYGVAQRIWRSEHSILWKIQRISGAFLVVMIPAHLMFMHLSPSVGSEASMVLRRMQSVFIKAVDLTLIMAALYHGGYGLFSIIGEYTSSRIFKAGVVVAVALVSLIFAWIGIKLTLTV